mgnify:CR=1 FL=1
MDSFDAIDTQVRLALFSVQKDTHASMFGRGIAKLCEGVKETGSLNQAAKDMGMAYSKAWRIVRETEQTLGVQLLDRKGAHGSTLTPEGEVLLSTYLDLEKDISAYASKRFRELIASQTESIR